METQLNLTGMGTFSVAVLEQSTYWRDGQGLVRRLDELDTDHLARLIPFLARKGEGMRMRWVFMQSRFQGARGPVVVGTIDGKDCLDWGPGGIGYLLHSDGGGNLDDAFDDWMDAETERPFAEWLEDRPLVKAIRALLAEVA
jgi:hypothetical protein